MSPDEAVRSEVRRAAEAIAGADGLLIGAGAGMGVDSGLPDFRGGQGFWEAYPPYARLGLGFRQLASPRWFRDDPALAWGFYGHRLQLYRKTLPHAGFATLRRWADRMPAGAFVYTSNVDGQFQRAGFDPARVVEVHGAIDRMQCTNECGVGTFPAEAHAVEVDGTTMRASGPLPECPNCQALARPNILMFGDASWDSSRADAQRERLKTWLRTNRGKRLVVVECGAGTAISTVRDVCEDLAASFDATLVRINPREPEVPAGHVSLPLGAKRALRAIDAWFLTEAETAPAEDAAS